jgi:hypothetical protein
VRGEAGIGKTALVAEFLLRQERAIEPLWVDCQEWNQGVPNFDSAINSRRTVEKPRRGAVLVLDGADTISDRQLDELYNRAINHKAIRSVIITSRRITLGMRTQRELHLTEMLETEAKEFLRRAASLTNLDEDSVLKLTQMLNGNPLGMSIVAAAAHSMSAERLRSFLAGKIFEISDIASTDRRELIAGAKPLIIAANQAIIARLRKQPTDVFKLTSRQYEELVAELLDDMGYEVELTPATRDGGKDILASIKTPTAKLLCLVEAKRYRQDRKLGVGLVRSLYGTLHDYQANSAMLVTTSTYSKDAYALQQKHKFQVSLKDYADVAGWIQDYGTKMMR